jgi:hypothetical protein
MLAPYVLSNLELVRTEIDQHPVLKPSGFEVTKYLSLVIRGQGFGGLKLQDQHTVYQQVRQVIADNRPVLIVHFDRMLLPHVQTLFPQPMRQRVLVDLLQVSMPVISVNVIRRLPHLIAEFLTIVHSGLWLTARNRKEHKKTETGTGSRPRVLLAFIVAVVSCCVSGCPVAGFFVLFAFSAVKSVLPGVKACQCGAALPWLLPTTDHIA